MEAYLDGIGFVASSAIQRGPATVLSWLISSPCELQTFSDPEDGGQWATAMLQKS